MQWTCVETAKVLRYSNQQFVMAKVPTISLHIKYPQNCTTNFIPHCPTQVKVLRGGDFLFYLLEDQQ
jgi:hypothetical protein